MFTSKAIAVEPLAYRLATRVAPRATVSRGFALGTKLKAKESVEEEKYIRELEAKFIAKKRAEMTEAPDMNHFENEVAPTMAIAQHVLDGTNDKVSHAGLEALARWKLEK